MNNKILSFLTALGLAAACLATSSAFALGAFRIGGYAYVESGVTITAVVARAVEGYGAGDADAAFREAYTDCETVRSANTSSDLGGIPVTDDINTNAGDCNELSIHGNDRSSTNTETDTFTNECLIIVRAMINPVTDPFDVGNYGIGIEDTCQDALDTAIGDCTNCATAGGQEALLLNSEDHVYVRDGNALACNDNYYNRNASDSENMNPDVIIDCQKASLSSQCRINDPTKPIFDSGNGTCVAATETANFARDTDLYPNTCYESFILEGGTERGSGRGGAFPFPRFDNGECMPALECNIDGEGTTDRLTYGCTPCSDFNRAEEGQNACSLECLSQHVDTGMYVYIDPDTRVSTVVDADHLTAPVYTMCTPAECVDFNREDRAAAGDSCGVCLERFNDTDLEEGEACVPNEECLGDDDGIPDGAGGCTDPGTCPENSVEMGASCMCVAPFINNPNEGEFCVLSCGGEGEEGQIANGNQCIEIFYSINGNLVSDDLDSDPVVGTEEEPFDIALGDVADFSTQLMVTILNSDDEPLDIMYSKAADIEQQSAELIVSGEGVITFDPETFNSDTPDTPVSPGMYSIVVAVNSAEDATNPLEEEILLGAVYVTVQAPFEEPEPIIDDSEQPDLEQSISESGGADLKIVLGVIGVGAWALYAYYWNVVPQYSWTPSYAFRNDNGNISYSVGSRWTATADNLQFYWQTSQSSASNGDQLVYGSGIKYNNGVFSAAMNSEGDSDETDLDISLLANKQLGLWQLKGGYNFDMQTSPTETDTQSRFNVAAQYSLNKWVLSTTANTNGDTTSARFAARYTVDRWILSATTNTDGDTTSARINYSYRF